jgi:hypothetical protein
VKETERKAGGREGVREGGRDLAVSEVRLHEGDEEAPKEDEVCHGGEEADGEDEEDGGHLHGRSKC